MPWLLLAPILLMLPFAGMYLFLPGSVNSDLLITHLPNALLIRQAFGQFHQLPLWTDSILGGYPLAAHPLSGLWYPPGWLAILIPAPWGFNLAAAAHLTWGGLGMYRLMRVEGRTRAAALLAGLLFEGMPNIIAHLGAGHITLVYAWAWLPWLLYRERMAKHSLPGWITGPGMILGVIVLADVRMAVYAGLILFAWTIWRMLAARGELFLIRGLGQMAAQAALALAFSAVLVLPFIEYLSRTTRTGLAGAEPFLLSLPPGRLLGLLFPAPGSSAEWVVYFSGIGLVLSLIAVSVRELRRANAFWLLVFLAGLMISLGNNFPGLSLLGRLPGISLLRVPPRALFISGLAICSIAAASLDWLIMAVQDKPAALRAPRRAMVGLLFFTLLLSIGFVVMTQSLPLNIAWGWAAVSLPLVVILTWLGGRPSLQTGITLLMLIAGADLVGVDLLSLQALDTPVLPAGTVEAAAYLAGKPGPFRIYSPSYSIPQDIAARNQLQLADGIDPLQLGVYRNYMSQATGIADSGYSVTLPPFITGSPATDNAAAVPDPVQLGALNTAYVVSAFDLDVPGLPLEQQYGSVRIYSNLEALPRARMLDSKAAVQIDDWSPDRIELTARGPGRLVLAEIAYPGWTVSVDGRKATIVVENGLFRAVDMPEGEHRVTFKFIPISVYLGLGISTLAWLAALAAFWLQRRGS